MIKPKLQDLEIGQRGYCVPDAMFVDQDLNCWLDLSFTLRSGPGGTSQLVVDRLPEDVWAVHLYEACKFTWTPTSISMLGLQPVHSFDTY